MRIWVSLLGTLVVAEILLFGEYVTKFGKARSTLVDEFLFHLSGALVGHAEDMTLAAGDVY